MPLHHHHYYGPEPDNQPRVLEHDHGYAEVRHITPELFAAPIYWDHEGTDCGEPQEEADPTIEALQQIAQAIDRNTRALLLNTSTIADTYRPDSIARKQLMEEVAAQLDGLKDQRS